MKMELNEAIQKLNQAGLIVEGGMSLDAKLANAKRFNAVDEHSDIVTAYKAIHALNGKNGWHFTEDYDQYFTLKELTDGTLEQAQKRNKGFTTLILAIRKDINDYGDYKEIELCVSSSGNPRIYVQINDGEKRKIFDVTEYPTAIEVAKNWTA